MQLDNFRCHADFHDLSVERNSLQESAPGKKSSLSGSLPCNDQHIFEIRSLV